MTNLIEVETASGQKAFAAGTLAGSAARVAEAFGEGVASEGEPVGLASMLGIVECRSGQLAIDAAIAKFGANLDRPLPARNARADENIGETRIGLQALLG